LFIKKRADQIQSPFKITWQNVVSGKKSQEITRSQAFHKFRDMFGIFGIYWYFLKCQTIDSHFLDIPVTINYCRRISHERKFSFQRIEVIKITITVPKTCAICVKSAARRGYPRVLPCMQVNHAKSASKGAG